jgi:hypothetical protein
LFCAQQEHGKSLFSAEKGDAKDKLKAVTK